MFTIADKEVDLRKAMPLTLGDMKALRRAGVDLTKMRAEVVDRKGKVIVPGTELDGEQVQTMIEHVVRKANPAVTVEELDATPITFLPTISAEIQELMKVGGDNDPSP